VSEIELHADGDQVLGARRPDLGDLTGRRLDGLIYNGFTIPDGLIVQMDQYKARSRSTSCSASRSAICTARATGSTGLRWNAGRRGSCSRTRRSRSLRRLNGVLFYLYTADLQAIPTATCSWSPSASEII
jgi:hypothetical protein